MYIGITASAFDILHVGHVAMLEDAKKHCDYLICCLHVDPSLERPEKNPPLQSLVERYIQLQAVRYVDEIIPYQREKDLEDIIEIKTPDVRIIGEEYKSKDNALIQIKPSDGVAETNWPFDGLSDGGVDKLTITLGT